MKKIMKIKNKIYHFHYFLYKILKIRNIINKIENRNKNQTAVFVKVIYVTNSIKKIYAIILNIICLQSINNKHDMFTPKKKLT